MENDTTERARLVELAAECDEMIEGIEARIADAREVLGIPAAKVLVDVEKEQLVKIRDLHAEIQHLIEVRS